MTKHNPQPEKEPALLLLEDGTTFQGYSIGEKGTSGGEICFNTGMTGYQEIYTDPSYYGQIIVNTTSHIGNYGVNNEEQESTPVKIKGLVVNEFALEHSRKTSDGDLDTYLKENKTVGIAGIDTRSLVRHIRSKGAMNVIISTELLDKSSLKAELKKVPNMDALELSSHVTTSQAYEMNVNAKGFKVAVLDLGVKASILRNFVKRDCVLKVFPAKTSFAEMETWGPDGYFLSNGPGDPQATAYAVETAKEILESGKPMFGICLGHQIIALALGIGTFKMHHGHRGLNHPVKNLIAGTGEITSQNHGFAVDMEQLKASDKAELTHLHLNDQTVAGLKVKDKPAFCVQYHPESSPGPHDSTYLFDDFIELLKQNKS